jgi:ribosomal protein S15P/S13E
MLDDYGLTQQAFLVDWLLNTNDITGDKKDNESKRMVQVKVHKIKKLYNSRREITRKTKTVFVLRESDLSPCKRGIH